MNEHELSIRVRYAETDRMGLLHHANYFVYFEMGRTELLRAKGLSYREVEDAGHFLVIIEIGCKFKRPAYYDDLPKSRTSRSSINTSFFATECFWPRGIRRWRASIARASLSPCPRCSPDEVRPTLIRGRSALRWLLIRQG